MRMVKTITTLTAIIVIVASLVSCRAKPEVLDGPDMVYSDVTYRTEYANVFDFDSLDTTPYFAVAFLGYGEDRIDFTEAYVRGVFTDLSEEMVNDIAHYDFPGDEWYLVVPRYKEDVDITYLETGEVDTVYNGNAFTVKCNLSDLHSNLEISTEQNLSGHKFSPQMGGDGKLVKNPDVWDITDYTVTDDKNYVNY